MKKKTFLVATLSLLVVSGVFLPLSAYAVELDEQEHVVANTHATIYTAKVVCDAEPYLPDWGDGGPSITATTATDYVAASDGHCELADWKFQWAPEGTENPGDNVEEAGSPWATLSSMVEILNPHNALVWLREVFPAAQDWLPFSEDTTAPFDEVSAEFYCADDVVNYDNYDYISDIDAGETFYCVGFNVKVATEETPECSDGIDNADSEDTLVDANDPGCLSGEDGSYNPNDTDETDDVPGICEVGTHEEQVVHEAPVPYAPNVCAEGLTLTDGQCVAVATQPVCEVGSYNTVTNQCEDGPQDVEVPVNAPASCLTGSLNTETDVCEVAAVSPTCPLDAPLVETMCVPAGEAWVETVCVPDEQEPADACTNIDGLQTSVPDGYGSNDAGICTATEVTPSGGGGGHKKKGAVLGATTSCNLLLTTYMKKDQENDATEVMELQNFLNGEMGMNLLVNGVFDTTTDEVVRAFQVKYWEKVLQPWWVFGDSGIHDEDDSTGFVYKTTRWMINDIVCPGSEAFPALP